MSLVINGRTYAPVRHTTFAQDIFIRQQVRKAGLDNLALHADEAPASFVNRLLDELIDSATMLPLLGGLLVPDGEPWSESGAAQAIAAFSATTDPALKAQLRGEVASLLAAFFANGTLSAKTSPRSSGGAAAVPASNAAP